MWWQGTGTERGKERRDVKEEEEEGEGTETAVEVMNGR